jgi:hypothetical protein
LHTSRHWIGTGTRCIHDTLQLLPSLHIPMALFRCCWIHLNPHVLRWIEVKFSLSSTPTHPSTCGLMWIWLHPNKNYTGVLSSLGKLLLLQTSIAKFYRWQRKIKLRIVMVMGQKDFIQGQVTSCFHVHIP